MFVCHLVWVLVCLLWLPCVFRAGSSSKGSEGVGVRLDIVVTVAKGRKQWKEAVWCGGLGSGTTLHFLLVDCCWCYTDVAVAFVWGWICHRSGVRHHACTECYVARGLQGLCVID